MQEAFCNFIWHTTRWSWLSHTLWRIKSLPQSDPDWRRKKKGASSCVLTCPPQGPSIQRLPLHLFRVFIMIFSHSTLTHWCIVWISADICVWWESTWPNRPELKQHPAPTCPQISRPDSPVGFRPAFPQVPALSQPRSARQNLIEDSTAAVKWEQMREQITLADFSPYLCWENGGVINSWVRIMKQGKS